jgi:multiple sugar transport system permease protein
MGYASALAWVLFVICLGVVVLVLRSSAGWVHYTGGE